MDKMIKVFVSCRNKEGIRRTAASDFWREDFGLSRSLVERVSWEAVLRQSGYFSRKESKRDVLKGLKTT